MQGLEYTWNTSQPDETFGSAAVDLSNQAKIESLPDCQAQCTSTPMCMGVVYNTPGQLPAVGTCASWCNANSASWPTKCTWTSEACSNCAECQEEEVWSAVPDCYLQKQVAEFVPDTTGMQKTASALVFITECPITVCPAPPPSLPPLPPSPPSRPPLSPITEDLFASAYSFFTLQYAEVGKQKPNMDDTNQVLRLGGGACFDDQIRGAKVELTAAWTTPPENWNIRSNEYLERACEVECLGFPGQFWEQLTYNGFTAIFGADKEPAGKLNCPKISELVFKNAVPVNGFKPYDFEIQNCPGIDYSSWMDPPSCIRSEDGEKQAKKGKHVDCSWRYDRDDCNAQDWCTWGPDTQLDAAHKLMYVPKRQSAYVAAQFFPGNERLPDSSNQATMAPPRCDCVRQCPKVKYTSDSLNRYSSEYGRRTTVQCSDLTESICNVQSYMPWPQEEKALSTSYTMVGSAGPNGMCSSSHGQAPFMYTVLQESTGAGTGDAAAGTYAQFREKCEAACNADLQCSAYDFSYYTDQQGKVDPANTISQTAVWQLGCRLYTTDVQQGPTATQNFPTCKDPASYFCFIGENTKYFTSECPSTSAAHYAHMITLASSVLTEQASPAPLPDPSPAPLPPPPNLPPSPPAAPPSAPPLAPGGCVSTETWKRLNHCDTEYPERTCPNGRCPQLGALASGDPEGDCNVNPDCIWLTYSPPSPPRPTPSPSPPPPPYDPPCDVELSLTGAPTYPAQTTMSTPLHWIKWSPPQNGQASTTVTVHDWKGVYTECYMRLAA